MENTEAIRYLKEKTRTYEQRLNEIKAQVSTLETEANYLQGLIKSANALIRAEMSGGSPHDAMSEKLSVLSLSEAIDAIVNSSKGPIHADEVLRKLREAGKALVAKNPKNSIVTLLHRGVKSGRYTKVGPNLYAPIRQQLLINEEEV